jgi:hypothetical protein
MPACGRSGQAREPGKVKAGTEPKPAIVEFIDADNGGSGLRRLRAGNSHPREYRYRPRARRARRWREDHARVANGAQRRLVLASALHSPVSRAWKGYLEAYDLASSSVAFTMAPGRRLSCRFFQGRELYIKPHRTPMHILLKLEIPNPVTAPKRIILAVTNSLANDLVAMAEST